MKRVALAGSSGGNLYYLGGNDAAQLIHSVQDQLARAGAELVAVCFVAAEASLDAVGARSTAALWRIEQGAPRPVIAGPLGEVNKAAQETDQAIASLVSAGQLDGLILISASPEGINKALVQAAARQQIPVAGSGGSSVAAAEAMGARLVSVSGTTGTTNRTRAISYAAGLSRAWGTGYQVLDLPRTARDLGRRYDPRLVLADSLPAICAIAAVLGLCRYLPGSAPAEISRAALPTMLLVISLTAASRISNVGQAGLLSGAIAGGLALDAGFLGALVAGLLAGTLADVLVVMALRFQWPTTTANILGSGLAGLLSGTAARLVLRVPGTGLDWAVEHTVTSSLAHAGLLIGLCLGALMWPILLRGLYHSVILPLMVIELSSGGHSFLAVLDMITLVAVSAGIALATIAVPRHEGDRRPACRTLAVNACFGTFVEGSFPHLKSHRGYLAVAMVAGAGGGAVAGLTRGYGVSYIPLFGLPVVGQPWLGLLVAIVVALAAAFLGTAALNLHLRPADLFRNRHPPADQTRSTGSLRAPHFPRFARGASIGGRPARSEPLSDWRCQRPTGGRRLSPREYIVVINVDPSEARRQLRQELRSLRDSSRLTQQQVAAKLDWSLSKLIRIESGAIGVSVTDLRALLALYGVRDRSLMATLTGFAKASRGRPWWHGYRDLVRPQFGQFLGYEEVATRHLVFGLALIPGILQSRGYADLVIRAHAFPDGSPHVERTIALRAERGARLFSRAEPAEVRVLLDEAALRRVVGGPGVMAEQVRQLLQADINEDASLGVVPFAAGVHGGMTGSFTVLQFTGGQDDVLYVDGATRDSLVRDDQEQIAGYLARFEELWASATTGTAARDLLKNTAKWYEHQIFTDSGAPR